MKIKEQAEKIQQAMQAQGMRGPMGGMPGGPMGAMGMGGGMPRPQQRQAPQQNMKSQDSVTAENMDF